MGSTYRPWRYANRDEYTAMRQRAFRNNAEIYAETARSAPAPPPPAPAAAKFDAVTAPPRPKGKGGGGFLGGLKDVAGEGAHVGKEVGHNLISGEKFQETLGIDTGYMDALREKGLGGRAVAAALDTITAPATLATIVAGPAIGAGIRGATAGTKLAMAGKVAGSLAEPALSGNVARRTVAELGAGIGGTLASEEATSRLPEGTPGLVRGAVGLGAGFAGGAAGLNAGRITKGALGPQGAVVKGVGKVAPGYGGSVVINTGGIDDGRRVIAKSGTGGASKPLARERLWFHSTRDSEFDLPDPDMAVGTQTGITQGPGLYTAADPASSAGAHRYGDRTFVVAFDGNVLDLGAAASVDAPMHKGGITWRQYAQRLADRMNQADAVPGRTVTADDLLQPARRSESFRMAAASKEGNGYALRDTIAGNIEHLMGIQRLGVDPLPFPEVLTGRYKLPPGSRQEVPAFVNDELANSGVDALFHRSGGTDGEVLIVLNGTAARALGDVRNSSTAVTEGKTWAQIREATAQNAPDWRVVPTQTQWGERYAVLDENGNVFPGTSRDGFVHKAAAEDYLRSKTAGPYGVPAKKGTAIDHTAPPETPVRRPDVVNFKHDEIQERPDLFQARNADPGKSYGEARVAELEAAWDPNMLETGSVVHDVNTGEYVVFSGHHRRELMKRKAAEGEFGNEAAWEVYDADLSNPEHVKELQRLADYKNYAVATTDLNENVRVYRRAKARGEEDGVVFDQMRSVDRVQRRYLPYIADLPDDVIERWNTAKGNIANLGEVGKAARTYKWDEREVRAIVGRYGPGGKAQEITPTALGAKLQKLGREIADLRARKGGFEGRDWEVVHSEVLERIDEIDALEAEIRKERNRLTAADRTLRDLGEDDPAIAAVRERLQTRVKELESDRKKLTAEYNARKRAGFEGGPRPTGEGLPEGDGGRPQAAEPEAPGASTPEDVVVGATVETQGLRGEVTAVKPDAIRIRLPDGREEWAPTVPDMFGNTPQITIIPKTGGLELEGGTRGTLLPPTNQGGLPGIEGPAQQGPATPVIQAEVPPPATWQEADARLSKPTILVGAQRIDPEVTDVLSAADNTRHWLVDKYPSSDGSYWVDRYETPAQGQVVKQPELGPFSSLDEARAAAERDANASRGAVPDAPPVRPEPTATLPDAPARDTQAGPGREDQFRDDPPEIAARKREIVAEMRAAQDAGDMVRLNELNDEYSALNRSAGHKMVGEGLERREALRARLADMPDDELEELDRLATRARNGDVNDPATREALREAHARIGDDQLTGGEIEAVVFRVRADRRDMKVSNKPAGGLQETGQNLNPASEGGRLPRPEGEPAQASIPDWERRTLPDMRATAPPGYRVAVAQDGPAEYRRVLTQADIDWIQAHPEPPPIGNPRDLYKGIVEPDAILDHFANLTARYHSKWNTPTPTLAKDWKAVRNQARYALQKRYLADALDGMGVEDIKELDPDLRRELQRDIRAQAKAATEEIETEITREEWWDALAPSKGEGVPGRPTGGIGGGVEEPTGLPPAAPPAQPVVRQGGTGTAPLGAGKGPVDLLGTRPKKQVAQEAAGRAAKPIPQLVQRVKSALGRLESDTVRERVDPILAEKNRIDNVVGHQVAWAVAREKAILGQAGLAVEQGPDGAWHLVANGKDVGLFEDVVERVSDAGRKGYEGLTPSQQKALAVVGETNDAFNGTKRFHRAEVREDDAILGDYFGRRALSREYVSELTGETVRVEKGAAGNKPSRKVGAQRTKSRTMESIEQGMEKGISYENPWEARAAILRGKLLDAEDAYLKNSLKNLRVKKPGSTLGLEQVSGHPAFNNMWFKPDVARRIQKGLDSQVKGPLKVVEAINSVLTPLRASFDLSATLQQGQRMWLTDPKHASEYWWEVVRSLKDPSVYDGMLLRMDADGPGLQYLLERGLRFTGEGQEGEFFFPPALLNKAGQAGIAGRGVNKAFTASNQHFGRLLNAYRLQMANSQYARLSGMGLSGKELDDAMRQSVDGINRSFGWTHSKPSTVEQALLFAPRYTRASLETMKAALTTGGIEGRMARAHLGLMLGEGAAIVWVLNTARGYETEFDPRDPNFLRLRNVGGLDVSPFGTYNTIFRTMAQGIAGDPRGDGLPDPAAVGKFVEGKLSPAVGGVYWPLKGETYLGTPLEPTAGPKGLAHTAYEVGKSQIPFGAQNLISEGPAAAIVGSTGLSANPLTPGERRDMAREGHARKLFGKGYDALAGGEKAQVNEQSDVAGHQAEVDRRAMRNGGDRGQAAEIRQRTASELAAAAEYLANGRDPAGKVFTGNDFRKAYSDTMLRAAGARKLLKEYGGDPTVNGWFRLYDQATMPNGQIDYERLERLQADYGAQHAGVEEKVAKETGIRDNAAVRELREARKLAKAYYDIPAYRGMTTEEAETAGQFLALAGDLVATGAARNRNHAFVLLRQFDAEGAQLAFRANRVGANPARKKFRQGNPLFAKYYYDSVPGLTRAA